MASAAVAVEGPRVNRRHRGARGRTFMWTLHCLQMMLQITVTSRAAEKAQPLEVAAEKGRPATEGVLGVKPAGPCARFRCAIAVPSAPTAAACPSMATAWEK